jgi:putative transposase
MINRRDERLSTVRQCELLEISRSGFYYKHIDVSRRHIEVMNAIDRIHTSYPFYGFRRIRNELRRYNIFVGRKLVMRLMKMMAIDVIYPKPNTSQPNPGNRVYPYLLRGLKVERCNQVWEMDITYVSMSHGFMYLAAIIDVHSRYVVHWDISNTMEAGWCKEIVASAIARHGVPEIFNTDQGSQFTSSLFTTYLLDNNIKVSMDGRGRAIDNIYIERLWRSVKQENIYLNAYETGQELYTGLREYFDFYNHKRCHQSLDYKCPVELFEETCKAVA